MTLIQSAADHALMILDKTSASYPSVPLSDGDHTLHVHLLDGSWRIWLNTSQSDFDGLLLTFNERRDDALTAAIALFREAADILTDIAKAPPSMPAIDHGADSLRRPKHDDGHA